MKQTLNKLSTIALGAIMCALGLIILSMVSCSPQIKKLEVPNSLPWMNEPQKPEKKDTISWIPFQRLDGTIKMVNLDSIINGSKIVIDTLEIAGEAFEIHDTIPCPGGLAADSNVIVTFTRILAPRKIPVSVTVMDTLWLTKPCPQIQVPAPVIAGAGWGERSLWLTGVIALLLGYWNQWRNRKAKLA